jgi:hypothetical protein
MDPSVVYGNTSSGAGVGQRVTIPYELSVIIRVL